MTKETFDAVVEEFAKAIRAMDPVIEANPDWWVEYHVDGFSSKVNTLHGQRVLRKHNILVVQQISHTSHINQVKTHHIARAKLQHTTLTVLLHAKQGFDKDPASASKRTLREWYRPHPSVSFPLQISPRTHLSTPLPSFRLPRIRESQFRWTIGDNRTLLLAMLVSEGAITGETWERGYKSVNLHPSHMQPIEVWLSGISSHLQAAGEQKRLIEWGHSPSVEEVQVEQGLIQLRAINPPTSIGRWRMRRGRSL